MNFHRDLMQPAQLMSEAEGLIARYPSLHQFEVDRLVDIYPRLSNVDVALMISDDDLGPRIESLSAANAIDSGCRCSTCWGFSVRFCSS